MYSWSAMTLIDVELSLLHSSSSLISSPSLPAQTVVAPDGTVHRFDVDPFVKRCLVEGLDEIGYTLTLIDRIEAFEARYEATSR